jgi:hypothetical protein
MKIYKLISICFSIYILTVSCRIFFPSGSNNLTKILVEIDTSKTGAPKEYTVIFIKKMENYIWIRLRDNLNKEINLVANINNDFEPNKENLHEIKIDQKYPFILTPCNLKCATDTYKIKDMQHIRGTEIQYGINGISLYASEEEILFKSDKIKNVYIE